MHIIKGLILHIKNSYFRSYFLFSLINKKSMDLNHLQKKTTAFVLLVACINFFMGCNRYFKPVEMPAPTVETKQSTIKKLSVQNKYFILRKGIHSYALNNIILDQEKMTMTANLSEVPDVHQLYLDQTKTKQTY